MNSPISPQALGHRKRRARQSQDLLNDFISGFQTVLEPLPGSQETAEALADWIVEEWGGVDLYFSHSLRGDTEALITGLGKELARLCPDASSVFLEQFQKRFHVMYGGMSIYIPRSNPLKLQKTYQAMFANWKAGESIRSLAKRYGYSLLWTRRILNEQVKKRRMAGGGSPEPIPASTDGSMPLPA